MSGPTLDTVIALTGVYPVGSPFGVDMSLSTGAGTYGNMNYAPCAAVMDCAGASGGTAIGLALGDGTGAVMSLPAGYTVSSAGWGVSGNQTSIVSVDDAPTPRDLSLAIAGANPALGPVRLAYTLPHAADVRLDLFDVSGRRVRSLVREAQEAGVHEAVWDGTDEAGRQAARGLYFARLSVGDRVLTRKVTRLE
jgi:hypothetical protein